MLHPKIGMQKERANTKFDAETGEEYELGKKETDQSCSNKVHSRSAGSMGVNLTTTTTTMSCVAPVTHTDGGVGQGNWCITKQGTRVVKGKCMIVHTDC